jgi:hypothetical protein
MAEQAWVTTACPACGLISEIVWRDELASTDGMVTHVYVRCSQRHWFLLPEESLASGARRARRARPPGRPAAGAPCRVARIPD